MRQLKIIIAVCLCLFSMAGCAGKDSSDSTAGLLAEEETKKQQEYTIVENEAQTEEKNSEREHTELTDEKDQKVQNSTIKITVGESEFTASLADNSSAQALQELLAEGPLTVEMSDYGDMEKVGSIGSVLPRNDEQISTEPGDVILYQGNSLVIYYDTNSWNFTRIGKIDGATQEELKEALDAGGGDVTVTFLLE